MIFCIWVLQQDQKVHLLKVSVFLVINTNALPVCTLLWLSGFLQIS